MKLLRYENAQIAFRGAQFNLIGVDYQRERTVSGQKQEMLANLDSLVRRDMPNILLSHNPNTFNRAAELGIELSLAGHTHGGQIQVEILDHRLSPARFITDYIAGFTSGRCSPRRAFAARIPGLLLPIPGGISGLQDSMSIVAWVPLVPRCASAFLQRFLFSFSAAPEATLWT